ncbi:methyltransferase domain-containing protein [Streptomyces zagrosensis]|uniref:Protein-L-isoaspartate O-methyltransferase n=1 Tax=Streptomyces zagrosensis TaxID=1042984 RepID=A0A7W9QD31_9ACTN|nr:methyltransferase domain-containing protein [Streptomyces zagrosensis]MBB5937864.1 protein-L-isoaspartate O-methyltransferase [Streptomyces zagrosensis]
MNWARPARELVAALEDREDVKSPRLREAVIGTPRHVFLPYYFENHGGAPTLWVARTETDGDAWLTPIYSNTTLVTELDPKTAKQVDGGWNGFPTSSSTQPGLVVRMLETLGIESEHDVLDAGLGTGYQAALIAHCLRDSRQLVTSDIGSTTLAQERMDTLGHNPTVIQADATKWSWKRQFDRIVFSFGLPRVTDTIRQAIAPGGRVIANVFGPISSALVVLDAKDAKEEGVLEGRFLAHGGSFMPARHERSDAFEADLSSAAEGRTAVPMADFDNYHFLFLLAAHLPGVNLQYGIEEGQSMRRLVLPDGRWGEAVYVQEEGAHPLFCELGDGVWETVERVWSWWTDNGRPGWDEFGLTVAGDGTHRLWHQNPMGTSWVLS